MKPVILRLFCLLTLLFIGCVEEPVLTDGQRTPVVVTSAEYIDDLLFVPGSNFQIQTNQATTFSSPDPLIKISPAGVVTRITSGEIVPIDITSTLAGTKTRIYALGATDNAHDQPYADYHGKSDPDPYASYVKGWKTLQKLPATGGTYGLIVRHADASVGRDFTFNSANAGKMPPNNWWKSADANLARQLNAQGRQRATALGEIVKDLGYPITRVYSSEFYRAVETVQLMNLGLPTTTDRRINHPSHYPGNLFDGMLEIMGAQPLDNKITLVVTHHPINEPSPRADATFPKEASAFTWTGAYFVKLEADKKISYEGAASWDMFKYWRDVKLRKP